MIVLRPISRSDVSIITALRNDCTSYRDEWITTHGDEIFVEKASLEIEEKNHGWFIILDDEVAMGVLRVAASRTMDDAMEIDYAVADSQRGRGHATNAVMAGMQLFEKQGRRFVIRVDEANHASRRVAEKCGFARTAKHDRSIDYGKEPNGTLLVFERVAGDELRG